MKLFFRLIKKLAAAAAILWLSTAVAAEPASEVATPLPGVLRIHYHRNAGDYKDYGLWLWDEVKKPSTDWPRGACAFVGKDDFGAYADVELLENAAQVGFLVVNLRTGEKEGGSKTLKINEKNEVWITEHDDNVYDSGKCELKPEICLATVISSGRVQIKMNTLTGLTSNVLESGLILKDRSGKPVKLIDSVPGTGNTLTLTAAFTADRAPLSITFAGRTLTAYPDWQLIDRLYGCDDPHLGCRLTDDQAVFKLWAPMAESVDLLFFDADDQTKELRRISMRRGQKGIWQTDVKTADFQNQSRLEGIFYQFEVCNPGLPPKRVLDPYARSMAAVTVDATGQSAGSSGDFVGKAAIVAPEKYGPQLSHPVIPGYQKREDAVIYEVHVRDLTSDPSIEKDLHHRWGTYRALIDKLPYIKTLGVTHIQLLPVMAWYFGDETAMGQRELEYRAKNNNYNWGYDPQNYFSPDGAYSEKPADPKARIAELKELIDAIHQAGMGVILDVVYTHMARASFLNDIVPDYYFFRDGNGTFLGDFGNNLATNRKMAARLLHDSVKYWFSEYKIDGMRFDMMGDATAEAIQSAFDIAAAINPQAIFIGEGWRTFKGHLEDKALTGKGADQDWMDKTDSVGVFSDEFRNELKSGFGCEGEPMFLTGGPRRIAKIFANIMAQPSNTPADSPGDMVQYIEAHDNLPLYDVIAQSIKKDPETAANDQEIHRRIRLGNAILLTAQGTIMLHAGQEYGRSKQWLADSTPEQKFHHFLDADGKPFKHPYFIHDSYDSSDAINRFDWAKVTDIARYETNMTTVEYTRGLIALRRSSDAFRLGSKALVDSNVKLIDAPEIAVEDLLIAYNCMATDGTIFHIMVNADSKARTLTVNFDLQKCEVVVDGWQAGIKAIAKPVGINLNGSQVTLEPLTAAVIRERD